MSAFGPMLYALEESVVQSAQLAQWVRAGKPCVYFIACGFGPKARVKIGKCTGHPNARMAQLQTGSAETLRLDAFVGGGLEKERELHELFAAYRIHPRTEWFRREGDLLDFIRSLKASREYGEAILSERSRFELEVTP